MKKKGSALILSILMLSFFMTITLTMYYIARNRNKRSIYKIKGMKISSGLDSGSAIAHYELYLADRYVSKGHPYEFGTPYYVAYGVDDYSLITPFTTTQRYTQEVTSGSVIIIMPKPNEHYTGVVLNNYNEYFGAKWDPQITGSAVEVIVGNTQPWIAEDKVIDGKIVSRAWLNNTGEKIVRLWTLDKGKDDVDAISIGGYRLININGKNLTNTDKLKTVFEEVTTSAITLTYEKIVSVSASGIGVEDYRITYVEGVEVTKTTSGSIVIDKDELNSMTVEKLK